MTVITQKTRRLLGPLVVLLAGAALGLLAWNDDGRTAPTATDVALALQWSEGASQKYDVVLDSSFEMGTHTSSSTPSLRVRVAGVLEIRTLATTPTEALVGMRLSPVDMRVNDTSDAETQRALELPFRVRFTRDGVPTAFEFLPALVTEHRELIENVVRTFQVELQGGESWVAVEPHASGAYEASYKRRAPAQWEKKKLRYIEKSGSEEAPLLASQEVLSIDSRHNWLAAMTVHETVSTKDASGFAIDITNRATLELLPDSDVTPPDFWSFVAGEAREAPVDTKQRQIPTNRSRKRAAADLQTCVAGLDAATQNRSQWIHRLRDLLQMDAELPFVLLEALKTLELSNRTHADLYLALELAGTTEAQAALASVIEDPNSMPLDNLQAIVALGAVAHPNAASLESLWQAARTAEMEGDAQVASTATLALGTVGSTLLGTDEDSYASLQASLVSGASDATGPERRTTFVLALGNTGDATLSPEIVSYLDDDDPRVRRAAARATEQVGASDVAEELMLHLEQEPNSIVRAAVASALVSWEEPPSTAMESIRMLIGDERDETVRLQMARVLGKNLSSFPDNRPVLAGMLRTEQSNPIRRQIAESLAEAKTR